MLLLIRSKQNKEDKMKNKKTFFDKQQAILFEYFERFEKEMQRMNNNFGFLKNNLHNLITKGDTRKIIECSFGSKRHLFLCARECPFLFHGSWQTHCRLFGQILKEIKPPQKWIPKGEKLLCFKICKECKKARGNK
jgi:hypothetical protein